MGADRQKKLPGIPDDLYEHYTVGMNGSERDEWQLGPFRLVRVDHKKAEPWLADLGYGVSALGATPLEACSRASEGMTLRRKSLLEILHSAEDTLDLLG